MLIDTHCHIHDSEFYTGEESRRVYDAAKLAGIQTMLAVGCDARSSREALTFALAMPDVYAIIGVHPHEARYGDDEIAAMLAEAKTAPEVQHEIRGIGEIGLDYFYTHSPKKVQQQVLEAQLQMALDAHLPVSFHVREAFDDFWPIFDNFPGIRGVLHSFTDNTENLEKGLSRGLFIGVNGISTFTKDQAQRERYDAIPMNRFLLETDAPFLAPKPYRGKTNQPAYLREIAEYHAARRSLPLDEFARITTDNATGLFSLA